MSSRIIHHREALLSTEDNSIFFFVSVKLDYE